MDWSQTLEKANGVIVHCAPDLDAVMAVALLGIHYPNLLEGSICFVPSGIFDSKRWSEVIAAGMIPVDVGGTSQDWPHFDHHGDVSAKGSATRLVAKHLAWENEDWIQPLLKWVDSQDRAGTNFRLAVPAAGGRYIPADHFLFTDIIRGSSNVRFSPFNSKVTMESRAKAFCRLVAMAQLIIRQFRWVGKPTKYESSQEAQQLVKQGLLMALAKDLELDQPFELRPGADFRSELGRLSELAYDGDRLELAKTLAVAKLVNTIRSPINLSVRAGKNGLESQPLALNFTLLAIAEQALQMDSFSHSYKMELIREAWLNNLAMAADFLEALNSFRKLEAMKDQREVPGVGLVEWSDDGCYHARRVSGFNRPGQSPAVSLIRNPTGHWQIFINLQNGAKPVIVERMQEVAIALQQAEPGGQADGPFGGPGRLINGWYFSEFGGLFNGTLTNPFVPASQIPPENVFEIVCQNLAS